MGLLEKKIIKNDLASAIVGATFAAATFVGGIETMMKINSASNTVYLDNPAYAQYTRAETEIKRFEQYVSNFTPKDSIEIALNPDGQLANAVRGNMKGLEEKRSEAIQLYTKNKAEIESAQQEKKDYHDQFNLAMIATVCGMIGLSFPAIGRATRYTYSRNRTKKIRPIYEVATGMDL